jgi:hypothetical protein
MLQCSVDLTAPSRCDLTSKWIFIRFRGPQALIVILGKVSAKEEISTVVVAARACGNVKNLSLLTGYTGGRQASCGHE